MTTADRIRPERERGEVWTYKKSPRSPKHPPDFPPGSPKPPQNFPGPLCVHSTVPKLDLASGTGREGRQKRTCPKIPAQKPLKEMPQKTPKRNYRNPATRQIRTKKAFVLGYILNFSIYYVYIYHYRFCFISVPMYIIDTIIHIACRDRDCIYLYC